MNWIVVILSTQTPKEEGIANATTCYVASHHKRTLM